MRPRLGQKLGEKLAEKELLHTPFPTFLDGEDWEIENAPSPPAYIQRGDGKTIRNKMRVPLDASEAARRIRVHEMAHVQHTPELLPSEMAKLGISKFETVNAVEDARLGRILSNDPEFGRLMRRTSILSEQAKDNLTKAFTRAANTAPEKSDEKKFSFQKELKLLDIASLLAASKGHEEEEFFSDLAYGSGLGNLDGIVSKLYERHFSDPNPEFSDTIAFAKELEKMVGLYEDEKAKSEKLFESDPRLKAIFDSESFNEDVNAIWGKMSIVEHPRTERMPATMRSRKNRPIDYGAVPRNWHRLNVDGKVFSRRIKRKNDGGTLLIDLSGSMGLNEDQILQIMMRWPSVTIAGYAGKNNGHGELWILAKNGKRVNEKNLRPSFGANLVDGPALDWLGKNMEPRVWVSDGYVTGYSREYGYDVFSPKLLKDAMEKVNQYRITRIEDIDTLLGFDRE